MNAIGFLIFKKIYYFILFLRIFAETLYGDDPELLNIWTNLPDHELKVFFYFIFFGFNKKLKIFFLGL